MDITGSGDSQQQRDIRGGVVSTSEASGGKAGKREGGGERQAEHEEDVAWVYCMKQKCSLDSMHGVELICAVPGLSLQSGLFPSWKVEKRRVGLDL